MIFMGIRKDKLKYMFNDIKIGPVTFHMYGLMIAIGFAAALMMCLKRGKKRGLNEDIIYGIFFCAIFGGMIGCRLLYYIVEIPEILKDPSILWNFKNGYVVYGGIIGGALTSLIYCRVKKERFLPYFDLVMPAVSFAQGFGRLGCFFAGCCYGIPYDPPIGICLKNAIGTAPTDIPLFPVQLLESGMDFLLAGLLQLCFRKRTRKTDVIPFYCIGYACIRLFTERFRYDSERGIYFGLATSEWISLALAICGVLLLLVPSLRRKRASHS